MLILCDFFFPLPFRNSLICCFLFSFFRNKNKLGYNISRSLFHHGRCWIYKIVLQNCTKVLGGMRPQETSAIFIHPLLETFSNAVVCEKMLAVCDHAELQLVRKKGDFHPSCSVTQLHMLDWILEKEVSNLHSNCRPTVCSCDPNSRCKIKSNQEKVGMH